jgi:hypothetical protein
MKLTALMGLIAVLAILAFLGNTTADYVGSEKCGESGCHNTQYDAWADTLHGIDFSDWDYHGTPTNKYTMYGPDEANGSFGSCAPCHVVGWKDAENGGTIEEEPWNSTHNLPLGSIGCENCHGPGSDHVDDRSGNPEYMMMGEFAYSLSCAGWATENNTVRHGSTYDGEPIMMCHDGGRMGGIPDEEIAGYYDSGHVSGIPSFVQGNADCYHCMASTGFIEVTIEGGTVDEVPDDAVYGIFCLACHDPHPEEEGEHYQLRAPEDEICELCHYNTHIFPDTHVRHPTTEFRKGINGQDVPVTTYMDEVTCPECHMYGTGHRAEVIIVGHSFDVVPQACVDCHSMYTNETAWEWVEETQEHIEMLAAEVDPLWEEAMAAREWATGNDTLTEDVNMTYLKGEWNIEYVHQEGSGGVHNPPYAEALIAKSMEQFKMVIDALDMGEVKGQLKWDDDAPIAGAVVKDGMGATVATADSNGSYMFFAPSGAAVYTVYSEGELIGTIDATAVMHDVADVGTTTITKAVEPTDDDDDDEDEPLLNTLSYILIVIIIILIVVMVIMMRK